MALLTPIVFHKKYVVRQLGDFRKPKIFNLSEVIFPQNATLHWTESNYLAGPDPKYPILKRLDDPTYVEHALDLAHKNANPIRSGAKSPNSLYLGYHQVNPKYRLCKDLKERNGKPLNFTMMNFSIIPRLFTYRGGVFRHYFRWENFTRTIWEKANRLINDTGRMQFIMINVPEFVPKLGDLTLEMTNDGPPVNRTIKNFPTDSDRDVLQIYKWMLNANLDTIPKLIEPKNYRNVVLIFVDGQNCAFLNMAAIFTWRQAPKKEGVFEEEDRIDDKQSLSGTTKPYQLGLRFIAFLNAFVERRTSPKVITSDEALEMKLKEMAAEDEVNEQKVKDETAALEAKIIHEVEEEDKALLVKVQKKSNEEVATLPDFLKPNEEISDDLIDFFSQDIDLGDEDDDLEKAILELEKLSDESRLEREIREQAKRDEESITGKADLDEVVSGDDVEEFKEIVKQMGELAPKDEDVGLVQDTPSLEKGILKAASRLAGDGLLSVRQLARIKKQSQSYKSIRLETEGSQTIEEFIHIAPGDTELKSKQIINPDLVLDKSMVKSTTGSINKEYLEKIHKKAVVASMMGVQHGAVAVTDFDVIETGDIAGETQTFKMRVQPINGDSSVISVKLPAVDPDTGTFMANDIKYRMLRQPTDMPIKKISPNEVILTSYYGYKIFVRRDAKVVNDFGNWLNNQIRLKIDDQEDEHITSALIGNYFDPTVVVPRTYSILSMGVGSIETPDVDLNFDYHKREELYGQDNITLYENNHSKPQGSNYRVIIGKAKGSDTLYIMGPVGDLYTGHEGLLKDAGSIYELLGISILSAPVDFATMTVLGKKFPMVLVFGYQMGLTKLIGALGVPLEIVPTGTRLENSELEYRLVFKDQTIIVPKSHELASLVLGGLRERHREIKRINLADMDRRDAYSSLFEATHKGVRFIRETDLLFDMFVDPITGKILAEHDYPTDVTLLLVYAARMLLTDRHKSAMEQMRHRGYERMAGVIYGELVKSIRSQRLGYSGSRRVDVNPFAVWKEIMSDASVVVASDINPIDSIKQQEMLSLTGLGGRTSRTVSAANRQFIEADKGTISEATVDSKMTGIRTFNSGNAKYNSLWGTFDEYDFEKDGPTSLLSTSALAKPEIVKDD